MCTVINYCVCNFNQLLTLPLLSFGSSYLGKVTGKGKSDIKPPDLWIHHDRMELKDVDKSRNLETTMTVTPIPRNSQDLDVEEKIHRDTLEKRAQTYIGNYFHSTFLRSFLLLIIGS